MRLLVTRPIEQAEPLAARLRAEGHTVLVEPMLQVRYLDTPLPSLDGVQALLLTSRNGVRALCRATERRDLPVIAVGDATAEEARQAGWAEVDSASGDGQDLVERAAGRLKPGAGGVLHVSGVDIATDIADALAARGFATDRVILYEAGPATELSDAARTAFEAGEIDAVLFHSPRSARTFAELIALSGLADRLAGVAALALSEQVAEPIRGLVWREVRVAERPNETALLALLDAGAAPAAAAPWSAGRAETAAGAPRPDFAAARQAPPAPPSPSRAPVLIAAALLGAVAGGVVAFGLDRLLPNAPPVPADTGALAQRIAELDAKIAQIQQPGERKPSQEVAALASRLQAIEQRLQEVAAAPAQAQPAADLAALTRRIEALENRPPPEPAGRDTDVQDRLADLAGRIDKLGQELTERPAVPQQLSTRLQAIEGQTRSLQERLAGTAPPQGEAARLALVLATGQLEDLVLNGRPYAQPLDDVGALLGTEAALLDPLRPHAERGVATLDELRASFPAMARAVVEAAAAGEGDSWLDHVRGRLAAAFVVRRTGEVSGEAADAVLARAETRLKGGDLVAAQAELAKLAGKAAEAAAGWRDRAQARLQAERTIADLKRRSIEMARAGVK